MVAQALLAGAAAAEKQTSELRTAVEAVLAGGGGVLELGAGRAADAAELAGDFPVLYVRGSAAESELPYAALADLLRPVLHLLPSIPEPQGDALRAVLALASPSAAERFAVCAGVLALLTTAAPVVVAIDDMRLLDAPSAEALGYALRRLSGTGIAALVAGASAGAPVPCGEDEPHRLLADAADAHADGRPARALRLLDEALGCTDDPLARADIQHLRARVSLWRTAPAHIARELHAEAEHIESLDSVRAASMVADAALASFLAGDLAAAIAAAERARELSACGGGTVEVLATGLLGIGELLRGRAEARPLLERFAPLLDDPAFLAHASTAAWPAALALVWLEEYERARAAFAQLVDFARTRRAPALLPHALVGLSELEFRTGDWHAAEASAGEAAHLAEETGQPAAHALALLALARVAAPQGREDDCTAHVFEAVRLAPAGAGAVVAYAGAHLGALELALGRASATIVHLEQVADRAAEAGVRDPGVVQSTPDLIEAYVRAGRLADARRALKELERSARAAGRPWALAAAARGRGLLARPAAFEQAFREALERHDTPFDRARTELCLGERLRRARRRSDARPHLRAALAAFERLGAAPWAARAAAELRATGETVRTGADAHSDELTPQELAIATLVAGGATNREAAAALYLSPKTVEAHLGRVYRKLGVRSRTELSRSFA